MELANSQQPVFYWTTYIATACLFDGVTQVIHCSVFKGAFLSTDENFVVLQEVEDGQKVL